MEQSLGSRRSLARVGGEGAARLPSSGASSSLQCWSPQTVVMQTWAPNHLPRPAEPILRPGKSETGGKAPAEDGGTWKCFRNRYI